MSGQELQWLYDPALVHVGKNKDSLARNLAFIPTTWIRIECAALARTAAGRKVKDQHITAHKKTEGR